MQEKETTSFLLKKRGKGDCINYLPICLPSDIFERMLHIPDQMSNIHREGHCMKFSDCCRKVTSEKHFLSRTVSKGAFSNQTGAFSNQKIHKAHTKAPVPESHAADLQLKN